MVNPPKGTTIPSTQPLKKTWPNVIIVNPKLNNNKGSKRLCIRKYEELIDDTPIIKAKIIIPHSNHGFAKKPRPIKGKAVIKIGTRAQWIAQNVDAVMPMLSNLEVILTISILQI